VPTQEAGHLTTDEWVTFNNRLNCRYQICRCIRLQDIPMCHFQSRLHKIAIPLVAKKYYSGIVSESSYCYSCFNST